MDIGYARVSTEDQSYDLQVDALQDAGCEVIYSETWSGKHRDRPELNNALKSLRKGDSFVVFRLDRLGRNLKDLVEIVSDLEKRGIGFKSLKESIDTTSPTGKLVFHIFASLAEFERNLISERTKAGLKAARARGRKGGRRRSLSRSDVRKIRALLKDPHITKTEVAKDYGVSRVTLNKYLNEPESGPVQ
ncbi:recombinase family protein [Thiomicrospira sp. WB1]|uniref:recombinase family protein n=1 Tax=Thiomicrospira sp. WB1 TaxID=1685380 RepID=UPI0007471264|nr:recombinase family protein [Thiomicrospira sp. WB1]KUJ71662.1 hypothetical protein AVO41_09110 [Thiomicrospira sp. WB1]